VVYLNEAGLIVQAPVISTTLQNSVEMVLPAIESSQTAVAYDQVQQNVSRYQLLEKKGTKEGYRDNRIGLKVIVKRENN
jgi:hypothetical protein